MKKIIKLIALLLCVPYLSAISNFEKCCSFYEKDAEIEMIFLSALLNNEELLESAPYDFAKQLVALIPWAISEDKRSIFLEDINRIIIEHYYFEPTDSTKNMMKKWFFETIDKHIILLKRKKLINKNGIKKVKKSPPRGKKSKEKNRIRRY